MKIVVMSDSHGNYSAVEKIMKKAPDGDLYIHLGDGEREFSRLVESYPDKKFRYVRGNCDYSYEHEKTAVFTMNGIKTIATHGHEFSVKYSVDRLRYLALENDAKIVLFGHTHCRFECYEDGIYFLNPGSCALPRDMKPASFGVIDISPAGIVTNIVEV